MKYTKRIIIVLMMIISLFICGAAPVIHADAIAAGAIVTAMAAAEVLPAVLGALGLRPKDDSVEAQRDFNSIVEYVGDYLVKQGKIASLTQFPVVWVPTADNAEKGYTYVEEGLIDACLNVLFLENVFSPASEPVLSDKSVVHGARIGIGGVITFYNLSDELISYKLDSAEGVVYSYAMTSDYKYGDIGFCSTKPFTYTMYKGTQVVSSGSSSSEKMNGFNINYTLYGVTLSNCTIPSDCFIQVETSWSQYFIAEELKKGITSPGVPWVDCSFPGLAAFPGINSTSTAEDIWNRVTTETDRKPIEFKPNNPKPDEDPNKKLRHLPLHVAPDISKLDQEALQNPEAQPKPDPVEQPDPNNPNSQNSEQQYHDPNHYNMGLEKFFPFCIPFDIYAMFSCLDAEPQTPKFHWEISVPAINETFPIDVDLSNFDTVALWFRRFQVLAFCIGLAWITRDKMIKG